MVEQDHGNYYPITVVLPILRSRHMERPIRLHRISVRFYYELSDRDNYIFWLCAISVVIIADVLPISAISTGDVNEENEIGNDLTDGIEVIRHTKCIHNAVQRRPFS